MLNSMPEAQGFSATVYSDAATHERSKEYSGSNRASNVSWHSDISYEKQPPGTTFFFMLEQVIISYCTLWGKAHFISLKQAVVTPSSFPRLRHTTDSLLNLRNALKVCVPCTPPFIKPSSRESVMVLFVGNL